MYTGQVSSIDESFESLCVPEKCFSFDLNEFKVQFQHLNGKYEYSLSIRNVKKLNWRRKNAESGNSDLEEEVFKTFVNLTYYVKQVASLDYNLNFFVFRLIFRKMSWTKNSTFARNIKFNEKTLDLRISLDFADSLFIQIFSS